MIILSISSSHSKSLILYLASKEPYFTIFENINQLIYQLTPQSVTTFGGKEIRPWQLRLDISHGESNKQLISRRHFIIEEPSCSFEGDVTTEY